MDFTASNPLLSCVCTSWYFSCTVSIIKEKDYGLDTNLALGNFGNSFLSKFEIQPMDKAMALSKKRNIDPDFILGLGGIFISFISLALSKKKIQTQT